MLMTPRNEELMGPPQIDGMPPMPAFPAGFINGGMPMGGPNQTPVTPFNPLPLSVQMEQRARLQAYPGPPSLAALTPPIPPGPRVVAWNPDEIGRPV
jgi:hypothetical protein